MQFDLEHYKVTGEPFKDYLKQEDIQKVGEYITEGEPKKETIAYMCVEYINEAVKHLQELPEDEKEPYSKLETGIKSVCPSALERLADYINKTYPDKTEEYKKLLFYHTFINLRTAASNQVDKLITESMVGHISSIFSKLR